MPHGFAFLMFFFVNVFDIIQCNSTFQLLDDLHDSLISV